MYVDGLKVFCERRKEEERRRRKKCGWTASFKTRTQPERAWEIIETITEGKQ